MTNTIVSKGYPFRKDNDNYGGIASLDSLNIKLHALECLAIQALSDHPKDAHLFHALSGITELLIAARAQSDGLEPGRIAADFAAIKKSKPTKK